jgi:hypothetical protein
MDQVKKVTKRRYRYKIDSITARPAMVSVDPCLEGMYRKTAELVAIGGLKDELTKRLLGQHCSSRQQNINSVVGF